MSNFSIFDGAMQCISGILSAAPAQYQPPPDRPAFIFQAEVVPEQYRWEICTGIAHQTSSGNVDFGPSAKVPSMCAKPETLAHMIGVRICGH